MPNEQLQFPVSGLPKSDSSLLTRSFLSGAGIMVYTCEPSKARVDISEKLNFKLIDSGGVEKTKCILTLKSLVNMILPCFSDYTMKLIERANQLSHSLSNSFSLRIGVALNYSSSEQLLCYMSFYFIESGLDKLFIAPQRKYENDPFWFNVFMGGKLDNVLREHLLSCTTNPQLGFTSKQSEIFKLILASKSTEEICCALNMNKNNLYKYFGRMKDKLSSFFEREFDTIYEAALFYSNCFCQ